MIEVSNIETWGFEHAIRGMRNPMNSWSKSDSHSCHLESEGCDGCENLSAYYDRVFRPTDHVGSTKSFTVSARTIST